MKLTNIRFDNNFIIFDKGKFYLSKIDKNLYEKSLKEKNFKLDEHKGKDVTKRLKSLMKEYDVYSHVHFYGFDVQKGGD